ncbi:MAG: molecular chaperone Tir [Holophagales bacterium]|nr:molecular chaperone Tir [Holophagales bacterium]MYH24290.1 molecular chaperone Tir [Holophagales bacterium]
MREYNLFISHSWTYGSQYDNLVKLLRQRPYFRFKNYSVPKDDPIHHAPTQAHLREAIRRKMAPCHVVIILAGVYGTYSKWINEEIYLAKQRFNPSKPILAVAPFGSHRTSTTVQRAADRVVRWSTESVVAAIRTLAP